MQKMTGARLFAEMMPGYEVSHVFFVPAFMLKASAEIEDMQIKRIIADGARFSSVPEKVTSKSLNAKTQRTQRRSYTKNVR